MHQNSSAGGQFTDILFIHCPLDPVVTHLHDGDETIVIPGFGQRLRFIDLLDNAADPASNYRIIDIVLQLLDLGLLDLNVQFLVLQRQLLLLDLDRVVRLLGRGSISFFLLQLCNSVLCALIIILASLEVDPGLFQVLLLFDSAVLK